MTDQHVKLVTVTREDGTREAAWHAAGCGCQDCKDQSRPAWEASLAVPDPEADKIRKQVAAQEAAERRRMKVLFQKIMVAAGLWISMTTGLVIVPFAIWGFKGGLVGLGLGFVVMAILFWVTLVEIWNLR